MAAPKEVIELVERFDQHLDAYRSGKYKEAELRKEFLDPFLRALGWDVDNTQNYAEAYKEVVHEATLKIGGYTKAPDYSFRIGGTRKFYVEAKKPSVDIKGDVGPAFQLRRYAWSAKLPLSILTDFEEFSVYDCRIRPVKTDKAVNARIHYWTYKEYEKKWDEIAAIFSKDAILKGSFDKYAAATRRKKGTAEVDAAFLDEIESWRAELAKNIALRNKLGQRELNYAVQQTIDRIIFLRICEDRGIEQYGQLQSLQNGTNVYERLIELFQKADDRYNSGLFHFKEEKGRFEVPDKLTLGLTIDDKPLKEIFKHLYFPDSPYEFSVLGAEILGSVYEQFLGKVIRLTAGHRAVVEDKPEVKKAGGVYYTPTYIVDYIVKHTVGKLVEGKTPKQVEKLRILDPACGSGSFLIGAYQFLLDWHQKWYVDKGPDKYAKGRSPKLYKGSGEMWLLTLTERKRILINNIYGVDIDSQAVEVTKLSLLLKVLEEKNVLPLTKTFDLLQRERVLPDLGNNIKCGNSLIGPDFYEGQLLDPLGDDERRRINVFDWDKEFSEIMEAGGFDAVIGNPPYLFITELNQIEKQYFFDRYSTSEYRFDVYGLFIELSINRLLQQRGYLSLIIPHTLLSNNSFEKLRRLILEKTYLVQVVDIGPGVFERAKNETMIFVACNCMQKKKNGSTQVILTKAEEFLKALKQFDVKQDEWLNNPSAVWLVKVSQVEMSVVNKLEKAQHRFGELCTINQGLRTGNNKKYLSETKKSVKWEPAVGGKEVGRYTPLAQGLFVYYEPKVLDAPRRQEIFDSPEKVVIQEIRNITLPRRLVASYDDQQFYCLQSTNVINIRGSKCNLWNIKFLLGILNSSSANFFFRQRFSGNNHIASNQIAQIPVPYVVHDTQTKVVQLVEKMLAMHKQLAAAKTPHGQENLKRQIDATDKQIDKLVYELYALTDEEIKILEGAA